MTGDGKTMRDGKTARRQDGEETVATKRATPASVLFQRKPPRPAETGEIDREGLTLDFGPRGQVVIVPDGSALARAAAGHFARAVEQAVAERGYAFVALSGGTTPRRMGTILAREPYRSRIPWDRVHVFWGDERWVPLGSPESNAGEARRGFLDLVPIPPGNVHAWDTAAESPREAAAAYEDLLREQFGESSGIPRFDLVLLGMGDDGHTASLFRGTDALGSDGRLAV